MAEVVIGFVSAGIGVAAFAIQIKDSIDVLRRMRLKPDEARKDLATLLEKLEILHQAVSSLKGYQPVDGIIHHVQQRYGDIETTLRDLLRKSQEDGEGHRRHWNRVQLMLSRQPKQQMRDLGEKINDLIMILTLAFTAAQCRAPSIQEPTSTAKGDPDPSPAQEEDAHHGKPEEFTDGAKICHDPLVSRSSESQQEHRIMLPTIKPTSHVCGARKYECSGNLASISGRFWFLQYTPLSNFIGRSKDGTSGCKSITLHLRLALSMYGVPIAIVAGIGFMVDETGFDIRPALRAERIVNYTSPGFETVWRLQKGLIKLPEARRRFIEIYRSDSSLKHHKDPAGNSYIHTLLRYPWRNQDDQFGLLDVLVTECSMTLTNESQRLCAEWVGEGRHLDLLDAILAYGFDATAIHASHFEQWPAPCSPDWYGTGSTPDPFFIDYVGTILRYGPSYSGSTNLHNVLLNGPFDSAAHWLRLSQPLEDNVNFLGQTPLHIVTTNPDLCRLVLEAGHDMNVTDKFGATPLMYAAAMGQREVTKLLISRGANPSLRDSGRNWIFLDYASFCGHWDLAMDAILAIQSRFDSSVFEFFVQWAIMSALDPRFASTERITFLLKSIQLSNDVNFSFEDSGINDNNLMHYARNIEMASTLVRCGFDSFNQKNSEGKLAINSLSQYHDASLIQFCLEKGTDVGNMSDDGRGILFELLAGLESFTWLTWDVMDSIKLCLRAGADPFTTDNCRCPCSPEGCHISSAFQLKFSSCRFSDGMPDTVWAMDFLTLVEEYRGIQAAKKMLLSLHRRVRCDQTHISVAHVCCHRGRGIGREIWQPQRLQDDDVGDMLDEESEFITALDMEMGQLTAVAFSKLLTDLMIYLKEKYDTYIENEKKERGKSIANSQLILYEVDYKADDYRETLFVPRLSAYSIARSMAEYAFWLQHECSRTDKSLVRNFTKSDWFGRRISWFREYMNVMEVTAEALEKEMEVISVEETRNEKIDCKETINSFIKALERASAKGWE